MPEGLAPWLFGADAYAGRKELGIYRLSASYNTADETRPNTQQFALSWMASGSRYRMVSQFQGKVRQYYCQRSVSVKTVYSIPNELTQKL